MPDPAASTTAMGDKAKAVASSAWGKLKAGFVLLRHAMAHVMIGAVLVVRPAGAVLVVRPAGAYRKDWRKAFNGVRAAHDQD